MYRSSLLQPEFLLRPMLQQKGAAFGFLLHLMLRGKLLI
jgi:hypothetical protein